MDALENVAMASIQFSQRPPQLSSKTWKITGTNQKHKYQKALQLNPTESQCMVSFVIPEGLGEGGHTSLGLFYTLAFQRVEPVLEY